MILLGCLTLKCLLQEWEKVPDAFEKSGLTLNGKKTIVGLKQIECGMDSYSQRMELVLRQKKSRH